MPTNTPSKKQQWYAVSLIIASNAALIVVRHAGMRADRRFLIAVGICLLGIFGGAIWVLISLWRYRRASSGIIQTRTT